ncbi:hypothetical protein RFM68_29870 [Mesorhizobium sp. MSK_1335]|uniref:Uncharacterized protein n=1 Tax=Mesorhizobium montanum TaxID=3072323 RepID=A0ABU4ZW90_9HYPH|nr:hypothetical protein [Mesorhizobium sp. MSK_1335]MDX8528687.1 hypothetical protein [Mesorhizobium sp. MSK_1335]
MKTSISELELQEMEARVEAAQPGPWKSWVEGRDFLSGSNIIQTGDGVERGEDIDLSGAIVADQDFIAAARQDVPRLIAEVRRLRAVLNQTK